jgi:hypothetical protein
MSLLLRYIPLALLALLLWILFRRRAYRLCPFFLAYVVFGVVAGLARLIARLPSLHNFQIYYATYWITEAGYDVLGILVMYEVLRTVLGSLTRVRWTYLTFSLVFIASVGLSLANTHAVPPKVGGLLLYIVTGEIAVRFLEVIVFAGSVTLVPVLGLRWRQYPFGVATGFGLYATVMLLTTTKFSDFGTRVRFFWGWTSVVAYSVAVLIWIWFFSVPQRVETPSSKVSAPSPGVLKQYKDALRRMR